MPYGPGYYTVLHGSRPQPLRDLPPAGRSEPPGRRLGRGDSGGSPVASRVRAICAEPALTVRARGPCKTACTIPLPSDPPPTLSNTCSPTPTPRIRGPADGPPPCVNASTSWSRSPHCAIPSRRPRAPTSRRPRAPTSRGPAAPASRRAPAPGRTPRSRAIAARRPLTRTAARSTRRPARGARAPSPRRHSRASRRCPRGARAAPRHGPVAPERLHTGRSAAPPPRLRIAAYAARPACSRSIAYSTPGSPR
jgi:translation initiation factor IF-3